MAKARIGYIGVGLMGLPMAARLVTRGYQVTAYDIAPDTQFVWPDAVWWTWSISS